MTLNKRTRRSILTLLLCALAGAQTFAAAAPLRGVTSQKKKGEAAADKTTGTIKGKVRAESGGGAANVSVVAERDGAEAARTTTDRKGDFALRGLVPGFYKVTFRKPGLSVGTVEGVEVRAGQERPLSDRLFLAVDEGSLAFLRGSVFTSDGRSVHGARVELSRVAEGETKKIDGRLTNESGDFVFRLSPERARYRVVAKVDGRQVTKDVDIEGASVYRIALSLEPADKQ